MKSSQYILPKKTSWFLLTAFFIFDNVFSYHAVTRLHGREANLVIAPLVERHPLLYFLCIPAQILIIYFIVFGIKKIVIKVLKKWKFKDGEIIEKIILGALVMYWAVGNSSMNLFFLLGYRVPIRVWALTSVIGVSGAVIYSLMALYSVCKKR